MKKQYQDLLKSNKIKPHKASQEEIENVIAIAERDLGFAKNTLSQNWDWAFNVAYNAALSVSRAYMYKEGYRSTSKEAHKNTWLFMSLSLPKQYYDIIIFFNRMRVKRNKNIYDHVGLITETEVHQIIEYSKEYVAAVKDIILSK